MGNFYVCVKEPGELRQAIVEGARGVLRSLQNYEDFKNIKEKKDAYLLKLDECVEQLKILSRQLNEILPEYNEEEVPAKSKKTKKVEMSVSELNKEIKDIEKKISALGL